MGGESPSKIGAPSPVYTGDDAELGAIMKRLLKKDSSTRKKALQEISFIASQRGASVVQSAMDHFVYAYGILMLDNDKLVREQLNITLKGLLEVEKAALGPFRRAIIGWLYVARADTFPPAAAAAEEVFLIVAPLQNRRNVILNLFGSTIEQCKANYMLSSEGSFSDAATQSPEALMERFDFFFRVESLLLNTNMFYQI